MKNDANPELTRYMEDVVRIPLLSREEEFALATKAKHCKTAKARKRAQNKLVEHNLRFVVQVANQFKGYCKGQKIELMDLIQEGNAGLIRAAEKFDPDKGFRFVTYAVWWIRAHIQKHLIASHSLVRLGTTQTQRKLFFKMGRIVDVLETRGEEETIEAREALAEELGVTVQDLKEMEKRVVYNDWSLDNKVGGGKDSPGETNTFKDLLGDDGEYAQDITSAFEFESIKNRIYECIDELLNEREKDIIVTRWLSDDKVTLASLGESYGISRERVRQIEAQALKKLRTKLQSLISRETVQQLS
jgi:RNA polymerase sigma-32 factor